MPRTVLAACLFGLIALPAQAQDARTAMRAVDISGDWGFSTTAPFHSGDCHITGDAEIRRAPGGGYICEIKAEQRCLSGRVIHSRQSCTASQDGDQLLILSTIESVEPASRAYYPDNFILTIQDASQMDGMLESIVDAPVTFFRRHGGIS